MERAEVLSSVTSETSWLFRTAARLVLASLQHWRGGRLRVCLPDGTTQQVGDARDACGVAVSIKDWRFFWRVLTAGDIGVGESYMAGEWECSDLVGLCRQFVENQSVFSAHAGWRLLSRLQHTWLRFAHANTLSGSRRNVQHHYDLSNNLYRLFLDETMMYSSAVFEHAGQTLAEAQYGKIDDICRRLALSPDLHILEIGSGWGSFALHAAGTYGCRVTSLTLSQQQLDLARERVAAAGLSERVDIRLCDYRQIQGQFDRIVSIEMFEAVGYEYYRAFFEQCARALRPGGRMFLQTITVPDQRFHQYRRDFDWIRKYIFPGGLLASVHEISATVRHCTHLRFDWLQEIGPHYARTLREWRQRFLSNSSAVRLLGFDERFARMWEFYLASCEAAFAARHIGNAQMILSQPERS